MFCRRTMWPVLALLLAPPAAQASKPIEKTLTGCVVDRVFYSIDEIAYRIATPRSLDLRRFEGKQVNLRGKLLPGDRFIPDGAPTVKARKCPAASLRLVRREKVMGLRVEATEAAEDGKVAHAVKLIGQAIALVTPPDCDTFTDRAHVMAIKGDFKAVERDLTTIKAKQCHVDDRMNPLLLADVGEAALAKQQKRLAVLAYELALAACDGDWCRPDIEKALAAAK